MLTKDRGSLLLIEGLLLDTLSGRKITITPELGKVLAQVQQELAANNSPSHGWLNGSQLH